MYIAPMIVGRFVKPWSIALIVILLAAVSPIRGISVLCISDMGHLEMEFVGSSCCDQVSAPRIPSVLVVEEAIDDCGSCVDILFTQEISPSLQRGIVPHYGNVLFDASSVNSVQIADFVSSNDFDGINPCTAPAPTSNTQFSSVIRC